MTRLEKTCSFALHSCDEEAHKAFVLERMTTMATSDARQLVQRVIEDKLAVESSLYIKFTALLNEKKAKIRLLLQKLSEYRSFFPDTGVAHILAESEFVEQQYAAFVKFGAPSAADLVEEEETPQEAPPTRDRSSSATPSVSDHAQSSPEREEEEDEDMTE